MTALEKFQQYAELKSELEEFCYYQIKELLESEGYEYGDLYVLDIIPINDDQFLCKYEVSCGVKAGEHLLHTINTDE